MKTNRLATALVGTMLLVMPLVAGQKTNGVTAAAKDKPPKPATSHGLIKTTKKEEPAAGVQKEPAVQTKGNQPAEHSTPAMKSTAKTENKQSKTASKKATSSKTGTKTGTSKHASSTPSGSKSTVNVPTKKGTGGHK